MSALVFNINIFSVFPRWYDVVNKWTNFGFKLPSYCGSGLPLPAAGGPILGNSLDGDSRRYRYIFHSLFLVSLEYSVHWFF